MIIGVSGKAQSGKDTCAAIMKEEYESQTKLSQIKFAIIPQGTLNLLKQDD